jgi:hypothetical protein
MSWHFSPAGGADCSDPFLLAGAPCVRSRSTPAVALACSPGSGTGCWSPFRSGTTFGRSTAPHGAGASTSSPAGSRASRSARRAMASGLPPTSGQLWLPWCETSAPVASWLRTCSGPPSSARHWSCAGSIMTVWWSAHPPRPWARLTHESAGGWLPTPTATANAFAPSMAKWPSHRRLQALCGTSHQGLIYEWLMGWPLGWTCTRTRLETARFRRWCTLSRDGWDGPSATDAP